MPVQRSATEGEEMAPETETEAPARRGSLLPLTLIAAALWVLIIAAIMIFLV